MSAPENKAPKGKHPNSLKNLKPVKPGEVRNPLGYKSHDPVKREIKKLCRESWDDLIQVLMVGSQEEFNEYITRPGVGKLQIGVANAIQNAAKNGNLETLMTLVREVVPATPIQMDVINRNINMNLNKEDMKKELEEIRARKQRLSGVKTT